MFDEPGLAGPGIVFISGQIFDKFCQPLFVGRLRAISSCDIGDIGDSTDGSFVQQ